MFTFLLKYSPLLYFTQSLWRDEVFSIFVAERPIGMFIGKLTFEPPFYYILLHFWMKLFGNSEIATRSLSFLGFILGTVVVIFWAEKHFKRHWLSWFLPLFFFFNPMLLYYAFEVRTYGWYIFFACSSMVSYLTKKWGWFTIANVLGFYTHAYMVIVPFVETIHYLVTHPKLFSKPTLARLWKDPMVKSLAIIALCISPWLLLIGQAAAKLKQSWYFPVDIHLIRSVLGNLFIGYEGTPWYLWKLTEYLSLILLAFFLIALLKHDRRNVNLLFFFMIFIPLSVVIGISFIKPLYVNRYVIPVTIAELFLLASAIEAIPKPIWQRIAGFTLFIFIIGVNIWYPSQHPKGDSRKTMMHINALRREEDIVLATSPLIFFEAQYYSNERNKVFLYNPDEYAFPWYVGDFIVDHSQMVSDFPTYPTRAFLIHENGTFDITYRVFTTDRNKLYGK